MKEVVHLNRSVFRERSGSARTLPLGVRWLRKVIPHHSVEALTDAAELTIKLPVGKTIGPRAKRNLIDSDNCRAGEEKWKLRAGEVSW